jgi:cytochrome c-type biogenesis protein CcmH
MPVFWILAVSMTAVALAFVLVPLLRPRPVAGPSPTEANLEVLRSQRREIEADVANGTLPREARSEALEELVGRAQADLAQSEVPVPRVARRPWVVAAVAAVGIPALAFGVYLAVGNPKALNPILATPPSQVTDQQIVAMVEGLARKVKDRPDDAQGWALLARSMAALGRFPEATEAYEHLAKLQPGDPNVLADWADSLAMVQGQSLKGRPTELVQQALRIDPHHRKALALAGSAALDAGDYEASLRYWNTLATLIEPGSRDEQQLREVVAEVRQRAAAAGKPLPDAPAEPVRAASATGKNVTGSVSLAPALAAKVSGGETLFIYARAEGGSRMPLAIVKTSAKELPMKFTLDDSQAMAPGMNISSAKAVRIEARVSRSGTAMPQSGDLVGTSPVVQPGAHDVNIVLDKVVP